MRTSIARIRQHALFGVFLVVLACGGGGDGGSAPPTVATVTVSPASGTVVVGATLQLSASAVDRGGKPLSRTLTWSSTTPNVATVSTSGLVTGISAGAATISATADGVAGSAQITVTPPPVASVVVAPSTLGIIVGRTGTLTVTTRDAAGVALSGRTVSWTSSSPAVATVSSSGATATVTAVAPGTTTVTATSEGVSGSAAVTVSPVPVASLAITPATLSVLRGATSTLTAATLDSAGAPLTGRAIAWTSSAPAVATVTATGNTVSVTGISLGTATVTATSESRSAAVVVTVTDPPLLITRDTTLGGSVTVSRVQVPRGVTVTVTQGLTLTSTGAVEIFGTLRGDCLPVSVSGASLVVRGVVNNTCSSPAAGAPLVLRSLGGIRMDSATVTGDGGVTVTSRPTSPLARVAAHGVAVDTLLDPCVIQHTSIGPKTLAKAGSAGTPKGGDGNPGASTKIDCGGHLQALGLNAYSQGGGPGGRGTSTPTQPAVGGLGGRGGDVVVSAAGKITFEISTLFAQAGGKGGDALDGGAGTVKEGTGGDAGASGLVFVAGAMGTEVKPSGLAVFMNDAALSANASNVRHGGTASVSGDNGRDAGSSAATPGENAKATGGKGGMLGEAIKRVIGDLFAGAVTGVSNIEVIAGRAGDGGGAVARGGDGGKGNRQFPDGARTGDPNATGGRGGDSRIVNSAQGAPFPGGPGAGGQMYFAFGMGGAGYGDCAVLPWLPGGKGGDGGTSTGKNGDGGTGADNSMGQAGQTLYTQALTGGSGGPGAGPGLGGAAGTKGHTSTGPVQDDGKSYKPGPPGGACVTPELDTRVSPSGGNTDHENFGRMGPRRRTRVRRRDSGGGGLLDVRTHARALAVHQVTIEGDGPWIPLTGTLDDAGNFSASGMGTYAGFTGIDATYNGKLTLDSSGRVIGSTGTLEIGKNGKLPGGQPIIYTLTAP